MLVITIEDNNGNSINLTNNDKGIVVENITGLEPVGATVNTNKLISYDGVEIIGRDIAERNIVLSLSLERSPYQARRAIYGVFTTGKEITVKIDDVENEMVYETDGMVESMEIDYWTNPVTVQVSILCPEPYLYDPNKKTASSAGVTGRFMFPFKTDSDETFVFGDKQDEIAATVNNDGVMTKGYFTVRAITDAVNPSIYNKKTGEFFKLNTVLESGSVMKVYTEQHSKRATITDTNFNTINALRYKTDDSTWLDVPEGTTVFVAKSDNGASMQIDVSYYTAYPGV